MLPIDYRPRMHESRNARRNLFGRVARVRPAWHVESVLNEKTANGEVLLGAATDPKQRIGRVLVDDGAVSKCGMGLQAFVDRPAKVQSRRCRHVYVFKSM